MSTSHVGVLKTIRFSRPL